MKHNSETMRQSRAWADAYCASFEGHWNPSDVQLATYTIWSDAVRECRNESSFFTWRRYGCRYQTLLHRRDKALFRLIEGIDPPPDEDA